MSTKTETEYASEAAELLQPCLDKVFVNWIRDQLTSLLQARDEEETFRVETTKIIMALGCRDDLKDKSLLENVLALQASRDQLKAELDSRIKDYTANFVAFDKERATLKAELETANRKLSKFLRLMEFAQSQDDAQTEQEIAASATFREAMAFTNSELLESENKVLLECAAVMRGVLTSCQVRSEPYIPPYVREDITLRMENALKAVSDAGISIDAILLSRLTNEPGQSQ